MKSQTINAVRKDIKRKLPDQRLSVTVGTYQYGTDIDGDYTIEIEASDANADKTIATIESILEDHGWSAWGANYEPEEHQCLFSIQPFTV